MASAQDLSGWDKDSRLFLFTSLTAGSSHIITATSRLETILKANKVPFQYVDTATDEGARRLWGRRGAKRKLPGLVKEGYVIGDLEEVEEWNEYGELKENIGTVAPVNYDLPPGSSTTAGQAAPAAAKAPDTTTTTTTTTGVQSSMQNLNMKEAASQAASIGAARKGPTPGINDTKVAPSSLAEADAATKPETMNSSAASKTESIRAAEDTSVLASNAEPASAPKASGPAASAAEVSVTEASAPDASAPAPETSTPAPTSTAAAPLSAVESNEGPETISAPPAGTTQQKHRGSSVSNASADEIKEVEQSTAIPEAEDEDETAVGGEEPKTQAKESGEPKTQAQESAAAEKASVSVED